MTKYEFFYDIVKIIKETHDSEDRKVVISYTPTKLNWCKSLMNEYVSISTPEGKISYTIVEQLQYTESIIEITIRKDKHDEILAYLSEKIKQAGRKEKKDTIFSSPTDEDNTFKSIKELHSMTGLTQTEFSKKYSIPIDTVKSWEASPDSKRYRPCPEYFLRILGQIVEQEYNNDN